MGTRGQIINEIQAAELPIPAPSKPSKKTYQAAFLAPVETVKEIVKTDHFTRSNILRWSVEGIEYDELDFFQLLAQSQGLY